MLTILVAGTPGCGKTTFVSKLKKHFETRSYLVHDVNVSALIKDHELHDGYDATFETYLINVSQVRKFLKKHLAKLECDVCLLETHTVDTIPKELPNIIIILSCRTEILYDRLVDRGYNKKKVTENMECEIMRIVAEEAYSRFPFSRIFEMPSNQESDVNENLEKLLPHFENNIENHPIVEK